MNLQHGVIAASCQFGCIVAVVGVAGAAGGSVWCCCDASAGCWVCSLEDRFKLATRPMSEVVVTYCFGPVCAICVLAKKPANPGVTAWWEWDGGGRGILDPSQPGQEMTIPYQTELVSSLHSGLRRLLTRQQPPV